MQTYLIVLALAASCVAAPPPGWYPSGRALLLPSRLQQDQPQAQGTEKSDEKESEQILDKGEYYVLLEGGKLQMVKYITSALKEKEDTKESQPKKNEQQQYPVYQRPQQYQQPSISSAPSSSASSQLTNPEPFARFQVEYFQFPQPGSKQEYNAAEAKPEDEAEKKSGDTEEPSGYESKVQYRDVKPISAPIYAHNPAPLIRILKK